MFKPDVKKQVVLKYRELFGKDAPEPEVTGGRMDPETARRNGWPSDTYLTRLIVEGTVVAQGRSRDWRKAYKLLKLDVERLFSEGVSLS